MQVTNLVERKKNVAFVMKSDNKLITEGPYFFETFKMLKISLEISWESLNI